MSEWSERSGIFKFFYILLSIVTFPVFAVLFLLKHPVWTFAVWVMIFGALAYYPISQGVKANDVLAWYQDKWVIIQKDMVAKAEEKGMQNFVPQAIVDNVKEIEAEEEEAQEAKGENYNRKVVRDEKSEETRLKLKKRGGFKKKNDSEPRAEEGEILPDNVTTEAVEVLEQKGEKVGGLSAFIKKDVVVENEGSDLDIMENVVSTEEGQSEEKTTATEEQGKSVDEAEDFMDIENLLDEKESVKEEQKVQEKPVNSPVEAEDAKQNEMNKSEAKDDIEMDFF